MAPRPWPHTAGALLVRTPRPIPRPNFAVQYSPPSVCQTDFDANFQNTQDFRRNAGDRPPRKGQETMPVSANTPVPADGFNPVAGIAAILFPGAGHVIRGQTERGIKIASGILGLFLGGILIGGIDVIDSKEDRVWFYGKALVGPIAFGVDFVHQNYFKVRLIVHDPRGQKIEDRRSAGPDEGRDERGNPTPGGTPPNIKSLSKVNELGTLFATVAGMLNVIVIVDAAFPTRRRPLRQVGLKATLADAQAPLSTPSVGDDPLQGGMPGVKK